MSLKILPFLFLFVSQISFAGNAKKYCLFNGNVGVGGKDVVSFFQVNGGAPKDGVKKYRLKFDGVIYQFSSNYKIAKLFQLMNYLMAIMEGNLKHL